MVGWDRAPIVPIYIREFALLHGCIVVMRALRQRNVQKRPRPTVTHLRAGNHMTCANLLGWLNGGVQKFASEAGPQNCGDDTVPSGGVAAPSNHTKHRRRSLYKRGRMGSGRGAFVVYPAHTGKTVDGLSSGEGFGGARSSAAHPIKQGRGKRKIGVEI